MQEDYNNNLIEEEKETESSTPVEEKQPEEIVDEATEEDSNVSSEQEATTSEDYNQLAPKNNPEVEKILTSLEEKITKYNNTHSKEAEEKKILNSRNLVLRLKKGQISKVVNEAKDNIAKLEKECFEKINSLESDINKLEKETSSIVLDLEKSTKIEVKKIMDAILAPKITNTDEAIDLISATDEELFARFTKDEQKIYELRIDGITKIAGLKRKYYDTKYENEKKYILTRLSLKREIERLKNKEDEEVANLRHIINEETNRLRDEEYFTNYNAMINLHAVNYKNKLYIENLKEKAYEEVNNIYLETDANEDEKLIHKEWYLVKTGEVKQNKEAIKKEYNEEIKNLDNEKQEYASTYTKDYLKEISDFKKTMATIKKQPKLIDDKYNSLVKSETSRIDNEYKDSIKKVLEEETIKKQMCKKTNNS